MTNPIEVSTPAPTGGLNVPVTVFGDLVAEAPIPARGILSQTLSDEGGIELVLFAFAPGEQLSEHTSARPAIIHILSGEGDLTVGPGAHRAAAGTWVRMPADMSTASSRARAW